MKPVGSLESFSRKDIPSIFMVTSVEANDNEGHKSRRCWGWFPTEQTARERVKRNACDMFEFIYGYAIVEKVSAGILPDTEVIQWFQWMDDPESTSPYGVSPYASYGWKECEAPEWSQGIVGF